MGITNTPTYTAQSAAEQIRNIDRAMLQAMCDGLRDSFNVLWNNPQGISPQDIAAVIGSGM